MVEPALLQELQQDLHIWQCGSSLNPMKCWIPVLDEGGIYLGHRNVGGSWYREDSGLQYVAVLIVQAPAPPRDDPDGKYDQLSTCPTCN